jgi:hypothetical protein
LQFGCVNVHNGDENVIHCVVCARHFGSGVILHGLHSAWSCICAGGVGLQGHDVRRKLVVQDVFVHGERLQDVRLVGLPVSSYELIYAGFCQIGEQHVQPVLHRAVVVLEVRVKFLEAVKHVEQKVEVFFGVVVVPPQHGLRVRGGLQRQNVGLDRDFGSHRIKREQRNLQNGLQRLQNGFKSLLFSAGINGFVQNLKSGLHSHNNRDRNCDRNYCNNITVVFILFFMQTQVTLRVSVVQENVVGLGDSVVRDAVLVAPAHALSNVGPFHEFQFVGMPLAQNEVDG